MYLQNYFHTDIDDLLRELIHPGGTANIGCWKVEIPHSQNAINDVCEQLSLKHQRYVYQRKQWGNIVVDIVAGSRNKDITMDELHTLLEHITQLSETKEITSFARTRVYEEEDAGCTMDAPIVVSILFETITFYDEEEACPYCAGESYPPDGKLMLELDFFKSDCKEIKVGETFTLDQKHEDYSSYGNVTIPRYPFTFNLLDRVVEWSGDPYDGDAVVKENGKLICFETYLGMPLGKGTYRYEQNCLTQIR